MRCLDGSASANNRHYVASAPMLRRWSLAAIAAVIVCGALGCRIVTARTENHIVSAQFIGEGDGYAEWCENIIWVWHIVDAKRTIGYPEDGFPWQMISSTYEDAIGCAVYAFPQFIHWKFAAHCNFRSDRLSFARHDGVWHPWPIFQDARHILSIASEFSYFVDRVTRADAHLFNEATTHCATVSHSVPDIGDLGLKTKFDPSRRLFREGNSGLNRQPRALCLNNQFILPLHRLSGPSSVFDSSEGRIKGLFDEPDPKARKNESKEAKDGSYERTAGGALLGAQILLVMGCLIGGFSLFAHTLENSARINPNAGALRILLSCLSVSLGGLLAVVFFAGL